MVPRTVVMIVAMIWRICLMVDHFIFMISTYLNCFYGMMEIRSFGTRLPPPVEEGVGGLTLAGDFVVVVT